MWEWGAEHSPVLENVQRVGVVGWGGRGIVTGWTAPPPSPSNTLLQLSYTYNTKRKWTSGLYRVGEGVESETLVEERTLTDGLAFCRW